MNKLKITWDYLLDNEENVDNNIITDEEDVSENSPEVSDLGKNISQSNVFDVVFNSELTLIRQVIENNDGNENCSQSVNANNDCEFNDSELQHRVNLVDTENVSVPGSSKSVSNSDILRKWKK